MLREQSKRGPGRPPTAREKKLRKVTIFVRPDQEIWLRTHPSRELSTAMREVIDEAIYGKSQEEEL